MTSWSHELAPDATIIRRLRVRGTGSDPVSVQRQTTVVLSAICLGKAGLPASAILCIRTFRDPLPGTLRLAGSAPNANARWQRAAADSMANVIRRAARPLLEAVATDSEAVLFLTPAEMLASLARDWCDGTAVTHWWWRSLCPGADIGSAVLRMWRESVESAPSAMQQLAAEGRAASFVRALNPAGARILLGEIIEKFGLAPMVEFTQPAPGFVADTVSGLVQPPAGVEAAHVPAIEGRIPPWRCLVAKQEEEGLAGDGLLLLVTCLLLERSPVQIRKLEFIQKIRVWLSANKDDEAREELAQSERVLTKELPHSLAAALSETGLREAGVAALAPLSTQEANRFTPFDASVPPQPREENERAPSPASHLAPKADVQVTLTPVRAASESTDQRERPRLEKPRGTLLPAIATTIEAADVIETEFGGVFYLVNLGIYLNLYGDFTTPLQAGLDLPIWDFVARMGRALAGGRVQADRVWGLLARLSGREVQTEPGAGFSAPLDWLLPADWADFQNSAGLPAATEPNGDVAGWLDWLTPYIEWRLCRGLGISDPKAIASLVCEQPARIRVTPTRLDVSFALQSLPVEVRVSGLDRNPGWVPSAGRFIEFHYD